MGSITKLTYNYSSKKSKNYNSVEVSEGFEMIVETPADIEKYNQIKKELQRRVDQEVEVKLNEIPEKKNPLDNNKSILDSL